jgi:hypothetical protein
MSITLAPAEADRAPGHPTNSLEPDKCLNHRRVHHADRDG